MIRTALLPLLLLAAGAAGAEGPSTLAGCEADIRAEPDSMAGYECLASLPRSTGEWEEPRRRLEAYLGADPGNHLARFALGALESSRGRDRAEELLRRAADGFAGDRRPVEEVRARLTLAVFHLIRGRREAAEPQLRRAGVVAAAAGDPVLEARVLNVRGRLASQENDLEEAWRLFKGVESRIVPGGPPAMQAFCLAMLGIVSEQLGRSAPAMEYHRRAAELQRSMGDLWAEARSRGNVAQFATHLWAEGEMSREEALDIVRGALEAAVAAGTRSTESRLRVRLAELQGGAAAGRELEAALAIARELRDARAIDMALRALALHRALAGSGREAMATLEEVLAAARAGWEKDREARALLTGAAIHQEAGRRQKAIDSYREAIGVIESIRDLQADERIRARFLSGWIPAYHRLFGLLADPAGRSAAAADIEAAFAVSERMRARTLLDALDAAGATVRLAPDGRTAGRRTDLLAEISALQRRLIDPELAGAERKEALRRLEELEIEEGILRGELARRDERFARLRRPSLPSLPQVQEALGEREALLSFQVARRENRDRFQAMGPRGGGSWVLVLTRDDARVYRLPGRLTLEPAVLGFLGLVDRGDGSEAAAAAELHRMLLEEALAGLPPDLENLVLIPDGILHHLPFAALRETPREEPLGLRRRLFRVPSAATWLRLRAGAPAEAAAPAVVLADPALATATAERGASTRSASLARGLELGPLPHARREARLLARRLGPRSQVRVGRDATEHFVKHARLVDFAVFHVAAHAVVDDASPRRSAILLAPGVDEEDGLLQIREVVELDLGGRLVVLSACRSAAGERLDGEGVLGLARAFFQAGAGAVVGSLWPLRDDQAALFFDAFYRELASGASAAAALRSARTALAAAGAPATAWAGIVLLGDGGLRPLPEGSARVREHGGLLALAALLLLLLAAGAVLAARRRGGRVPATRR